MITDIQKYIGLCVGRRLMFPGIIGRPANATNLMGS